MTRRGSVLLRRVRLVPVGPAAPAVPDAPVDLRITAGVVAEIGPGLRAEAGTDVLDAAGRWLLPGLWDAHVHLGQWTRTRTRLDVSGTARAEDVLARVAAHVAGLPPAAPGAPAAPGIVVGYGFRSATWPRPPTVAELDAVSAGHAVVLVSGDAHNGWLNSAALARLGLPPATGPLAETEWFPVLTRLDAAGPGTAGEIGTAGYRDTVRAAAARGVVGVVDMEFADNPREWPERFAAGVDGLRVRAATYPDGLDAVLAAGLRTGDPLPAGDGLLTMGPLKVIADGSLNTRTAWCRDPYPGAAGSAHPNGRRSLDDAALTALLTRAREGGVEAAVHAIGDAALTAVLDAFTASGARGSVEHLQLVDPADLPRAARLGLRASVQPAHLYDDRDVTEHTWPGRAGRCFALRAMADAGMALALGSDAPVAPLDPWLAMAAAVHRSADDRPPWHPEQSLTTAEALAASTDGRGVPAAGAPGDVVLLDADPLREPAGPAAAAHLRAMPVAATFVAGVPTHLTL